MTRLYEPAAYAPQHSYWAETGTHRTWQSLRQDTRCDVAVIGGGYTGLNAALTLAQAGRDVVVLDAEHPGWGASTRNGGFCCLGGALLEDGAIQRLYGESDAETWHSAQRAAIDHTARLLDTHGIDADRHSNGETVLAHSPRAFRKLRDEAKHVELAHSVTARLMDSDTLHTEGFGTGWHGGLTIPLGFALNPRKYHDGLSAAAEHAGARLYGHSAVTRLAPGDRWTLTCGPHSITAKQVILATNGYSSEDLPPWLRARTLPVQSSVIVTRPLTARERDEANWTTVQMAYDSRRLLHYFRMLPEGRFLFGMRGGLTASPREQANISRRIRRDFRAAFPAWRDVEITHEWSGLVCLMARGHPFTGPVPGHPGLFASLGYHGNGVAMGSYAGHVLGQMLAGGETPGPLPAFTSAPPKRFPLGRHRRTLLRPAYWMAETFDL